MIRFDFKKFFNLKKLAEALLELKKCQNKLLKLKKNIEKSELRKWHKNIFTFKQRMATKNLWETNNKKNRSVLKIFEKRHKI